MRCPNCNGLGYQFPNPCPNCHFQDSDRLNQELTHIEWLLNEIPAWEPFLGSQSRSKLEQTYLERRRQLEIELGLRLPPFTPEEAAQAWPQLIQYHALLNELGHWLEAGYLAPTASQSLVEQTQQQVNELQERLEGHPRPTITLDDALQLSLTNFLLDSVEQLSRQQGFATAAAEAQIRNSLLAEQEQLEIKLGLRPAIVEEIPAEAEPQVELAVPLSSTAEPEQSLPAEHVEPAKETPTAPVEPPLPPAPRLPFRERLWQTLLSERTLQAMLFLGIFLLFSAALSFVAWGWKDFSAPVRVAVPTGFTALFFTLGWYVRTKTPMYRSAIALSAIAALLIPIDFYTVYVNFHIPPDFWPSFWLITSLTCLVAYVIATFIIGNQFFGYLVGVAAGSVVLAGIEVGHQTAGLSTDWRSAGLSALALGLLILATTFAPPGQETNESRFSIFANPFRYLALLGVSVIMLLTFGWRFLQRDMYDTLHYATTVNWWIGSFVFAWGAIQYRSRGLGLLAGITLPVAIYLTQAALFNATGINPAWHAFGWALLVPLYLLVGYNLLKVKSDPVIYDHGRNAVRWGVALLVIAAFWSLTDLSSGAAAASSYTVLAGAVVLAALLWQRPIYLYGASLLAFSAVTFALSEMELTLAQLSVGWASLAIVHLVVAVNVGTRFPIPTPNFARPLVVAGYLIAFVALLPPLFPYDGGLLAYGLFNWIALVAWGARLAHVKQPGFVAPGLWRKPVFHWLTTVPLPIWVWVWLNHWNLPNTAIPLALAGLAWGMILVSYRLTKVSAMYKRPWYLTGGLVSVAALLTAFALVPNGFTPGLALLAIGLLYFVDAVINRQAGELAPAGLITAWGYVFILNRFQLPTEVVSFDLAALIAGYILIGLWVERKHFANFDHRFLSPLYITSHLLTVILLVRLYTPALDYLFGLNEWPDSTRLWGAAGQLLLAGVYGLYAWGTFKERWGHFATWLAAAGCAFVGLAFNAGHGSVVAEFALIAIALVLAERGLHYLRQRRDFASRKQAFIRLSRRLFKRPLLLTGWIVSGIVIGLALLHNLVWLGGGQAEKVWAIIALTLITALYAGSAWLFRQARFVWLAAALSVIPWTILASSNWFTPYPVTPATFVLGWVILAWLLFLSHLQLTRRKLAAYALAPRVVAHALLVLSLAWSILFFTPGNLAQAVGLLAAGLLYFAEAIIKQQSSAFTPGVLVTGWGYVSLLGWFDVSLDALGLGVSVLVATFMLAGLEVERRKSAIFTPRFLAPLYLTTHILTLGVLWQVYVRPFDEIAFGIDWTDTMRLWAAGSQLVLGVTYGLYAWGRYKERWGHFAVWLVTMGGMFVAIVFSTGRGSSAAKVALWAIILVLVERGLNWVWRNRPAQLKHRQIAFVRLTWRLYWRPLLVTGWVVSAAAIGLALFRNLLLLGGGYPQKVWAMITLWLVVGLYALSARLFRQARFVWLAAPLSFIPWTLLTHLGWFTPYRPTLPGYALSWVILAWGLLLISLFLERRHLPVYGLPLKVVANGLAPFALLWGIADVDTSRFTFGLAIGFYSLAAVMNHRHLELTKRRFSGLWRTKYFYPALGLLPLWGVYLMAWLLPGAQREHYGLMFLVFGPLGLVAGQWLRQFARQAQDARSYGLPAYFTGYVSLVVGTALVAHQPPLLAMVLLFDAALFLISAWLFRQPGWVYPAVIVTPLSLLLTLQQVAIPLNRYGWWLIGLVWVYLVGSWILYRARLGVYGLPLLLEGFFLIALNLPFSSLDKTGALWGYGNAILFYMVCAIWLRQPLLLTPASVLAIVPFGVMLAESRLAVEYYGFVLVLGAVVMLSAGWVLDERLGSWRDFPWGQREEWFAGIVDRLVGWWAMPLYGVGFILIFASPFFVEFKAGLMALTFLLMMPMFGWAIYRFRLRGWLVALVLAGHFAGLFYLGMLGWWSHRELSQAWLRFMPVTLVMVLLTLVIAYYRSEPPPLKRASPSAWSHVLYPILLVDIMIGQMFSLINIGVNSAFMITLIHALFIAILASFLLSSRLAYLSIGFGLVTLMQWVITYSKSVPDLLISSALLALMYGFVGYGLALIRLSLDANRELRSRIAIWEVPLQRFAIGLSLGTLVPTLLLSVELLEWTLRAIFGLSFRHLVDFQKVQMFVGVSGFLGLLYVIVAVTHRWLRLGYIAIGMLLTSWVTYVFYVQAWDNIRQIQWYVIPVGLFLLGIAYMEWQQGHKSFGRRLDYLAMMLMLGSLFWQTFLFGWGFALLLGGEGLAAFYWGSARRLRRFLYAGMVGVILATLGQLLNSLSSINQWIVFGIIGLILVLVAVVVERKLEDIKAWQNVLESWE
jgi:hypothetical protein